MHAESLRPLPVVIPQILQVMLLPILHVILLLTLPEAFPLGLAFQLFAELLLLTVT